MKRRNDNRQLCKLKIGKSYWQCSIAEGKVDWSEWVLRTIRKEKKIYDNPLFQYTYAHFVSKIKHVTWVKLSRKHFDYGWDKNIHRWFRRSKRLHKENGITLEGQTLPRGIFTTRLKAANDAVKECKKDLNKCKKYKVDDYWTKEDLIELVKECQLDLTAAKRNLTRQKSH